MLAPAAWHVVDFEEGPDGEFPAVARPTFSPYPPAAYRLAEPGDTIDRVALYASAVAIGLAVVSIAGRLGARAELGVALLAGWVAANPWPTLDGWHGYGLAVLGMPGLWGLKALNLGVLAAVAGLVGAGVMTAYSEWGVPAVRRRSLVLAAAGAFLAIRLIGWPDPGPPGYWPRWAHVAGASLAAIAAFDARPRTDRRRRRRPALGLAIGAALVGLGIESYRCYRPIDRLREIEPGRIYISAMPDRRGLERAHERHHFRTIINLFQEELPGLRSPHLDDELAFVADRGVRYLRSPLDPDAAEDFLDETFRLARDPDAWPILVHCHGCMDRTPAWWGIYQFLYQGRSMAEVMRSIEQHRGTRPKALITFLYNRELAERAPDRYRDDPAAAVLRRAAAGVRGPYELAREPAACPAP